MSENQKPKKKRRIVHMDMDAFFASVEQRDNPDLRGKPVVIGADPKEGTGRGVVSTCSYEARKFGIHSAMPVSQAYRACPQAIFVPGRYAEYTKASRIIMEVLGEFSPLVEPLSIDEAFLDCSGTYELFGDALSLANRIRERVWQETELTCSVGVAPNKFIAKVASDLNKPDGVSICLPGKEKEFLGPLPLKRLWGAGKKTIEKLNSMGLVRIQDVANAPFEEFESMGKWGAGLWLLANGLDDRPVSPGHIRKSISEEHTYEQDQSDPDVLEKTLFAIAERLARRMRKLEIQGRTITLKIRLTGFQTFTRSVTLPQLLSDMRTIRETALQLFRDFDRKGKQVRLLGIGVSKLGDEGGSGPVQLDLFSADEPESPEDESRHNAELLLDELKEKFGNKMTRGAFLGDTYRSGDREFNRDE